MSGRTERGTGTGVENQGHWYQAVGQTGGREVFHHGDDAGNPFSVEKDHFPTTVILPKGAANGGEQIRLVKDSSEFLSLAKDLKRQTRRQG